MHQQNRNRTLNQKLSKISNWLNLQKSLAILALALTLITFTSCGGSYKQSYKDVNYYVGTEGLEMQLTNKDSLDEVYEGSSFAYSLTIENKGAYSIVGDEFAVLTIGFDPFYITADGNMPGSQYRVSNSTVVVKGLSLIGKSRYYPSGSRVFFYFPHFKTKNVSGQRTKPETQLFTSICYPYSTTLSTLVCIDFDVFKDNTRSQVCSQQDISSPDQGAPVAVTAVEVENLPLDANLVRPVYTIHVENVGTGFVVSPAESSSEIERVCTNKDLSSQDFNTVNVEAYLSNNIKLECTPKKIRLTTQEGISRCTVTDEDLPKAISYRQNYQAPLTINVSYIYLDTLKQNIEIKRINPLGDLSTSDQEGCLPFQIEKGGECINRCTFCAENPSDSICNPAGLNDKTVDWNPSFGCRCSEKTCSSLFKNGLCMPLSNFCSPASYCCSNQCSTGQFRGLDGKCYSKCSTSCIEAQAACLCMSEADTANLREGSNLFEEEPMVKGLFCSKDGAGYESEKACSDANAALASSKESESKDVQVV